MATIQAIAVTGLTIRNLLSEACPRDVFAGAQFLLVQSGGLASAPFTGYGVSIYLYRVVFNGSRRNLPPRRPLRGPSYKPPVPLDLHFLLTAWGRVPEEQWALLAWTIRTLEDSPILFASVLNQNAGSDVNGLPQTVFDTNEDVDLVGESLSIQDLQSIWEIAKHNQQPSVSYVARAVLIDSTIELGEGAPVQTRAFNLAEVPA